MELLSAALMNRAGLRSDRNDVAMPFAEGVVDLMDQRSERPVRVTAEVDADRVEAVTKRPRHAEELDAAVADFDPGLAEMTLSLQAKRCRCSVAVVAIPQAEEIGLIVTEQSQRGG